MTRSHPKRPPREILSKMRRHPKDCYSSLDNVQVQASSGNIAVTKVSGESYRAAYFPVIIGALSISVSFHALYILLVWRCENDRGRNMGKK